MFDVIVIGGGQAGLAAGYHLKRRGLNYLILDAQARAGDSWRKRWEGLSLFSPQRYNQLPDSQISAPDGSLPDKSEIADYLEQYARLHQLTIVHSITVIRVAAGRHFTIESEMGEEWEARHVIVASGAYRTPFIPKELADRFPTGVRQLHSSQIGEIDDPVDGETSVLIIGAGASGQQLTRLALAAGGEVILSGPKVANLPREVLGKDIYWWLYHSGMMSLRTDIPPGKWLIGAPAGTVTVAEAPIAAGDRESFRRITAKLTGYQNGRLQFAPGNDGTIIAREWPRRAHGLVIWCTGYRNTYPWLPAAALDDRGVPSQRGGVSKTVEGLYYLGLENLRHTNSSLVGGVGRDAEQITDLIADRGQ